jgi:STE24 endopeptidase
MEQAGRAARAALRLLFCLCLACSAPALSPQPVRAAPGPSYVDRRVSEIPSRDLLARSPDALVDPRRQESAHRLRVRTRPLYAVWFLAQSLGLIVLWRRGAAARLRNALAALRSVHAIRFAFGFVMTCIVALIALPAAFVLFRLDVEFGVASGRITEWLRDVAVTTALEAFLAAAFVVAVFWLVDRSRLWYVIAAAGVVAGTLLFSALAPVAVAPLFDRSVPLSAANRAAPRLLELARAAGIAGTPILVADTSRRAPIASARAEGVGPTSRIVIADSLLAVATRGEIAFVAAREFVRAARGDVWRAALFRAAFFIACAALAILISDRIGFRRDDDPLVRIALSFGILGAILFVAGPVERAYSRGVEARQDREALALTGDRAAAVRAFIRLADESLAPVCPSRIVRLYYYDRPPIGSRIAAATGRPDPCP